MKRVVLVLGLAGLLAGCGGSGKATAPQALPPVAPGAPGSAGTPGPPSSAPSAGASDGSTKESHGAASVAPSADTSKEAVATARAWIQALNTAYRRVDARPIRDLSSSTCQTCQNYIGSLEAAAAAHKTFRGGEITVRDLEAPALQDDETVVVALVSYAQIEELDVHGVILRSQPALDKGTLQISVKRVDRGFIVSEVLSS